MLGAAAREACLQGAFARAPDTDAGFLRLPRRTAPKCEPICQVSSSSEFFGLHLIQEWGVVRIVFCGAASS